MDTPIPEENQSCPSPRRSRAGWLWKLGLLLLGVAVACAGVELGVLCLVGEQPKFPRHVVGAPWGVRINEPNAGYRHKSADVTVQFRINEQGMRSDRDYTYEKPEGVQRVISIGDSFTAGYEVDVEDCFSSVLERCLTDAGQRVEVLNAGVSGYGNAEACLYLDRELLKYDPDVVLLSFYSNDLVDNVRSELFRLDQGRLIEGRSSYVPAGGVGDFLNTNRLFNLLSERSNAFVFLKERATLIAKRQIVRQNLQNVGAGGPADQSGLGELDYQKRMASAILDRIYELARGAGATLIVQSIPYSDPEDRGRLLEMFPVEYFDVDRPGLVFISMKGLLERYAGEQRLYWDRSHNHWTPFSHKLSGEAIAEAVLAAGLW